MFHLKYPRFRGFFSWDELGCLSRALGFPVDIFNNNLTDEILVEDNGLPLQETIKVLDHKLLYKCLHLTQNLHTADWNSCVFRKCIYFLEHRALTYSEINNARVAYQTYEAGDMKGMLVDQQILMRTLRMCDKTISPMKLMHRIKHSQSMYEEPGRIQLYEFLELLLWADGYKGYITDETFAHFEMDGGLFKLSDFDNLLSHHDDREANRLNTQYLKEEWEFPEVKVKDTKRFKDPTVICGDSRAEMDTCLSDYYLRRKTTTTSHQKQTYRYLRSEVSRSQTTVHYVKGGFVRKRPITAPNLKVYSQKDVEEFKKRQSLHAQSVIDNKLQDLLKHAYNKDKKNGIEPVDMSDRPVLEEYKRSETPKVVSKEEMKETIEGWECLLFDVETEEGRYEINRDDEMEKIIPKYKERRDAMDEANRIAERNAKPTLKIRSPSPKKFRDPHTAAISLAYPVPRLPPSHGRSCDARFRGWYGVRSKKGPHYILMSPHFTDSPKGQLFRKLAKMSDTQIKQLHGDFLYRKTGADDLDQRPVTAPAVMTMDEYQSKMEEVEKTLKGQNSILSRKSSGYSSMEENDDKNKPDATSKLQFEFKSLENEKNDKEENGDIKNQPGSPGDAESGVDSIYDSKDSVESSLCEKLNQLVVDETNRDHKPRAKSAYTQRTAQLQSSQDPMFLHGVEGKQPRSKSAFGGERHMPVEEIAPMPYMDHSKAKVVSVGSMGKVSILESISEAKYWEDLLIEQQKKHQKEINEETVENDAPDNDESGAVFDRMGNDAEEDNYIEGKISSHGKKRKSRKHNTDNESDILSLILKEEKKLRAREKRNKSKSKFDPPSNKSTTSSDSTRSSSVGSSMSRSSKSPQNLKISDPAKNSDERKELNDSHKLESDGTHESKKHVVVNAPGDRSARREKTVRKYERLVNRLGDDITPYMKKQMLKVQM